MVLSFSCTLSEAAQVCHSKWIPVVSSSSFTISLSSQLPSGFAGANTVRVTGSFTMGSCPGSLNNELSPVCVWPASAPDDPAACWDDPHPVNIPVISMHAVKSATIFFFFILCPRLLFLFSPQLTDLIFCICTVAALRISQYRPSTETTTWNSWCNVQNLRKCAVHFLRYRAFS